MKNLLILIISISLSIIVFTALNVPLAWLLGPIFCSTVLSFNNIYFKIPIEIWNLTRVIMGIYLGSKINSDFFINLSKWSGSFFILIILIILSIICVSYIYRKFGSFDLPTSISSSTPGGMNSIFLAVEEIGGKIDSKKHFITHLTRIFLVVSFVPFFVKFLMYDVAIEYDKEIIFNFEIIEIIKLLIVALIFSYISYKIRLPAPIFLGSIIGSGLMYGLGYTSYDLPDLGLNICLIMIGCVIGFRFHDYRLKDFLKNIKFGMISFIILMFLTFLFSYLSSIIFNLDFLSLFMSYVPGGIYEMTGIAISFDYEVDFILAHHLVRLFVLILFIPIICKFFFKK